MKLTIATVVYATQELHIEFTEKTLNSIKTKYEHEVLIINNYCKPEFREQLGKLGTVIDNPDGNCLASAWNLAIKLGIEKGSDYILLPNNDILFHPNCIDNLVQFAQENPDYGLWSAGEWHGDSHEETNKAVQNGLVDVPIGLGNDDHPHFSCFMVGKDFVTKLAKHEIGTKEPKPGYFDENIRPAYFEDGDMHQRLLRAGLIAGKTATALFYHFGSRTIALDDDLDIANRQTYEKNRNYFKEKWGFDPHGTVVANDSEIRFLYGGPFEPKRNLIF